MVLSVLDACQTGTGAGAIHYTWRSAFRTSYLMPAVTQNNQNNCQSKTNHFLSQDAAQCCWAEPGLRQGRTEGPPFPAAAYGHAALPDQAQTPPGLGWSWGGLLIGEETCHVTSSFFGGDSGTRRWIKHRSKENEAQNIQIYWENVFSWENTRRKSVWTLTIIFVGHFFTKLFCFWTNIYATVAYWDC